MNYRPASVLTPVSKFFEKLMQKQINEHIKKQIISLFMWIQKGFQYTVCFIVSYRTLEKVLDEKGFGEAVLMDLSKAFDTLNHEVLIAKFSAYGFNNESLKLIQSYLTNRWQ